MPSDIQREWALLHLGRSRPHELRLVWHGNKHDKILKQRVCLEQPEQYLEGAHKFISKFVPLCFRGILHQKRIENSKRYLENWKYGVFIVEGAPITASKAAFQNGFWFFMIELFLMLRIKRKSSNFEMGSRKTQFWILFHYDITPSPSRNYSGCWLQPQWLS